VYAKKKEIQPTVLLNFNNAGNVTMKPILAAIVSVEKQ
jgi:hypothetical protein